MLIKNKRSFFKWLFKCLESCLFISICFKDLVFADEVNDIKLFNEDLKNVKDKKENKQREILKPKASISDDLKFDAPNISFNKENNQVNGKGGVVISYQGFTAQADEGVVNVDTKDSELKGGVALSWPEGTVSCDSAEINLDSETGVFKNGKAIWEDGQYHISAKKISKLSEFDYRFDDASFTSCDCENGTCPWSIRSKRLDAHQEGYGIAHNTWFEMYGVPVFYTPYILFPVKTERQSGLLAPSYGYSSEDGLSYSQPIFTVLDDSSDILFEPFIETKTRRGSSVEFRDVFSEKSNLTAKVLYSDESPRDGDLRGTRIDDVYDPTFDENRFGVYAKQLWKNDRDASVPLSLVSDIHYVSDDLFLRELDDSDFGLYNQRYATSTMVGTANLGEYVTTSLSGEYNQSLFSENDDYVFQRLPEVAVTTKKNFRPFGFNPYGLKLQTSTGLNYTEFVRDQGYDGSRVDINPTIKIPYHYKNYFNGQAQVGMHYTSYFMNESSIPNSDLSYDDGDRTVGDFTYTLSTGAEKIYEVDESNPLSWLTSVGYGNRDRKLRRLKHTVEPIVGYRYVPKSTQDDLPLYDSLDRIRHKSLFLYGVKTSLYGRYLPNNVAGENIAELTPEIEDLPTIDTEEAFGDLDEPMNFSSHLGNLNVRNGETREIMSFYIRQTYDYILDYDSDDETDPFSDISMTYTFDPTPSLGFDTSADYDYEDGSFSSWEFNSKFYDDRKDALKFGYSYIDKEISQLTSGVELTLTDRFRTGYYARFDSQDGEFMENIAAIRYTNPCNCWYLDLGYRDRLNPDKTEMMLTLTFRGLGGLSQRFGVGSDGDI